MVEDINLAKEIIAKRVAKEFKDGQLINLGIGLPGLVANYIPDGVKVSFQSENGMIGMGPAPEDENKNLDITNAGGGCVTVLPGGCFFDSATSFALIRGGHVEYTVLGALEVDEEGNLSNWIIPGKKVPGMGGAMDLVVGAKKVIVATLHTDRGRPKILKKCKLPLTAKAQVDMIVTELGVFEILNGRLMLVEKNENTTIEEIKRLTEANFTLSDDLL